MQSAWRETTGNDGDCGQLGERLPRLRAFKLKTKNTVRTKQTLLVGLTRPPGCHFATSGRRRRQDKARAPRDPRKGWAGSRKTGAPGKCVPDAERSWGAGGRPSAAAGEADARPAGGGRPAGNGFGSGADCSGRKFPPAASARPQPGRPLDPSTRPGAPSRWVPGPCSRGEAEGRLGRRDAPRERRGPGAGLAAMSHAPGRRPAPTEQIFLEGFFSEFEVLLEVPDELGN